MNAVPSRISATKRGLLTCRSEGVKGLEGRTLKVIELVSSAVPSYIGIPSHHSDLACQLMMGLVDMEVTLSAECLEWLTARLKRMRGTSGNNSGRLRRFWDFLISCWGRATKRQPKDHGDQSDTEAQSVAPPTSEQIHDLIENITQLIAEPQNQLLTKDNLTRVQEYVEEHRNELKTTVFLNSFNACVLSIPSRNVQGLSLFMSLLPEHHGKWASGIVLDAVRHIWDTMLHVNGVHYRKIQAMISMVDTYERIDLMETQQEEIYKKLLDLPDATARCHQNCTCSDPPCGRRVAVKKLETLQQSIRSKMGQKNDAP